MAARKGPRRRRPTPAATPRPADDTAPLPRWVERMIARGKLTEDEYRERQTRLSLERREDLIRRVPPAVEDEGAEAVEAWADEWTDPRCELADTAGNPRAPLPWAAS